MQSDTVGPLSPLTDLSLLLLLKELVEELLLVANVLTLLSCEDMGARARKIVCQDRAHTYQIELCKTSSVRDVCIRTLTGVVEELVRVHGQFRLCERQILPLHCGDATNIGGLALLRVLVTTITTCVPG